MWLDSGFRELRGPSNSQKKIFCQVDKPSLLSITGIVLTVRPIPLSVEEMVNKNRQDNSIQVLPIELEHVGFLKQLPQHHKDPFDRIIIA